jgi:hypothetical protein
VAEISGGAVWWLPVGADDHVQVSDTVMSYEIDGELRLAEAMATDVTVTLNDEVSGTDDHA